MVASKELLAKKLTSSEFLQRCSYKQKILPHSVIDTSDKFVSLFEDQFDDDEQNKPDVDLNLPSTSADLSTPSSSQSAVTQCACCWYAKPSVLLLPCKHVSACTNCWTMVRQGLSERLQRVGVDFAELEQRSRNDPTFKIPTDQLPKCPYCRAPVETAITDVFIP